MIVIYVVLIAHCMVGMLAVLLLLGPIYVTVVILKDFYVADYVAVVIPTIVSVYVVILLFILWLL